MAVKGMLLKTLGKGKTLKAYNIGPVSYNILITIAVPFKSSVTTKFLKYSCIIYSKKIGCSIMDDSLIKRTSVSICFCLHIFPCTLA